MLKNYRRLYISLILFTVVATIAILSKIPFFTSLGFYSIFIFLIFLNNKKSILRKISIGDLDKNGYITICIFALAVILLGILPMGLSPFFNGKIPMHRNQYEVMADSILDGHIYMEYDDIDPQLLTMENPYDWQARIDLGVNYHWDHAFYNGHYYMYFGVVPVFFLFIPFKLIFGKTLVTFHASQFFTLFSVIAFFILFYMIARKFFKELELGTYLLVTSAVCMITLGYITQAPALYCTAIGSGIFFMLWSFCFYFYAVYYAEKEWVQVLLACLGGLCGALAFGCRPPVAIANLIAIPMAITYAKGYKGKHIIRNFVIIAIPYVIVAALLMTYNYLRFDSPFEFGQSYQLTSSDQTAYLNPLSRIDLFYFVSILFENFFTIGTVESTFPFFFYGGAFVTYPLMWLVVILFSKDDLRKRMKEEKVWLFSLFLLLEPILVTILDVIWSPGTCERYRLDIYFVLGILVFMLIGYRLKTAENRSRVTSIVTVFASVSMLMAVLMFFYPLDGNYTYEYPEALDRIRTLLTFGLQ